MSEATKNQGFLRYPERIDDILKLISKIWHKNPDLRLCQLIRNCFPPITPVDMGDLYYIEDNDLRDRLIKCYNRKE